MRHRQTLHLGGRRRHRPLRPSLRALLLCALLPACTNNPYPDADSERRILYLSYATPPRTLDPAVAYSTADHVVTGPIYDTLLEYHYLQRPYTLIPGLAAAVPEPVALAGGKVSYRFRLRPDLLFQDDACFSAFAAGRRTRQVTTSDVAFALARLADPAVNSPVAETFAKIAGFRDFAERLASRRAADPAFAALRADEQYAGAGGIAGVRVLSPLDLEIVLDEPYPQILFWFAMPFTAPVPWEAVARYDGRQEREAFADHPVGAGPFRLVRYERRSRIVLERNDNWYGVRHPEWKAPGAVFPGDDPRLAGAPLPLLERIEFRRDAEPIPAFVKFMQGYYDASVIVRESFDRVVHEGRLSADMAALGMRLEKTVTPAVYYLGFNMDDPVIGAAAGERGRALRQAMSLAIDAREFSRLFMNGRGIPAETPIPPGIFGYDESYRNPFRQPDLERAARLLAGAGYAHGIDPATGRALRLTFDVSDTSARALLQFQFFVRAWRRLGLDVELSATDYNQFQDKVRRGAYQIFWWGWVADYPDPENFLFLLYGPMGRTRSGGPNTANFADPRYDALFVAMKARPNDAERERLIRELRAITERERPWVELFHPEDYAIHHGWLANVVPSGLSMPTEKYYGVDPGLRARLRAERNRPVRWPAFALAALVAAAVSPGIARGLRRRG